MLDPIHYTFTWCAVPTGLTTLLVAGLSLAVLIRERASSTSLLFAALGASIAIWQFSFTMMYSTQVDWVGLRWAKAAYFGVPFIPSAIYHFTASVLGIARRHRALIWVNWLVSAPMRSSARSTDTGGASIRAMGGSASRTWHFSSAP
jgi:hypothetical protein